MNTTELVIKAKKGDSEAFGELYSIYRSDLYRYALYLLGNSSDAEDAVQSAIIQAWKNLPRLNKSASFRSWLFKILTNVCKKMLSKRHLNINIDDVAGEISITDNDIALKMSLETALKALNDEEREIIFLSVLDNITSNEIGKIIGKKPTTVRSILSRGLKKLRDNLQTGEMV